MIQDQTTINSPSCGDGIDVNDALYHQVDEKLKKSITTSFSKKKRTLPLNHLT
ncbi:MAG: hypothetical protein ACJAUP_003557 [Cellvibrionaceae bacterium]|jgi:hypothetical protein